MLDAGTVELSIQQTGTSSVAHAISRIEGILVQPEVRAKVVIDQRSGTIVMGEDVRISKVAVAKGNLTLRIQERPIAIQPNPFAPSEPIVVPRTNVELNEVDEVRLAELSSGTSLSDVVSGLNAIGVKPRDMIDILKAIKAAGALHAELVVQ